MTARYDAFSLNSVQWPSIIFYFPVLSSVHCYDWLMAA